MLVLTRRINQAIVIGEDIRIVVVGVEGDRVQLGIDAPAALGIRRENPGDSGDLGASD